MGRLGKQFACFESDWQMHTMGSFAACHSLMTNGTSDSSDIDNPSPDAKTVEKQGARHKPKKSGFSRACKKL